MCSCKLPVRHILQCCSRQALSLRTVQKFLNLKKSWAKFRDLYSRAFLGAQHFLSASHSEILVISIRAPFFERSIFYLRAILKSSRTLFARLVLCPAFSIRETFWKTRDLCLRAFLWAPRLVFFGCHQCVQWNILIVVLYTSLPLCMGESDVSFQEDLLSHEYVVPRPCVSRTNSLV